MGGREGHAVPLLMPRRDPSLSALNRADYAGPQLTAAQNQMLAGSGECA